MDPEVSVLLHCLHWRGLREDQVRVELSRRYNRQRLTEVEQQIEEVWKERVTHEPWLFNGAKFRLHSATFADQLYSSLSESRDSDIYKGLNLNTKHRAQEGNKGDVAKDGVIEQRDGTSLHLTQRTSDSRCEGNACKSRDKEMVDTGGLHISTEAAAQSKGRTNPHEVISPIHPGTQGDLETGKAIVLTLRFGLTCYKDFLGTNWSKNAKELVRQGTDKFGHPEALLAQPLGVGGILRTVDKQVVFLRRSQMVAEASGLLDIPGGHPEPKAVCRGVREESIQLEHLPQEAVVRELFSSIQAEIRDEVNVPLSCLSKPVLMGIALNHVSAGRPSAEFYVSCSLTAKEVKEFYVRGGPEANESTDIVFLSEEEVLKLDVSAPLWSELCPSAKGAVLLYRLVLPDND